MDELWWNVLQYCSSTVSEDEQPVETFLTANLVLLPDNQLKHRNTPIAATAGVLTDQVLLSQHSSVLPLLWPAGNKPVVVKVRMNILRGVCQTGDGSSPRI